VETEDLTSDFAHHCHLYQDRLRNELMETVILQYGKEMYEAADKGLDKWVRAADLGKVGRGRMIGKKEI
jgi:hypothetical protein